MGLDITRMNSTKQWGWAYGMLHKVRWLAAMSCGFKGNFKKFSDIERTGEPQETWKKWPSYYQLMHFSDAEGVFVHRFFLEGINYKSSFNLGDYDELKKEITRLWKWVHEKEDRLLKLDGITKYEIEAVDGLYELLVDDDGYEVLLFH